MSPVICAEGVGKSYVIHHQTRARYATLAESLVGVSRKVGARIRSPLSYSSGDDLETFWALRDLHFTVSQGDRLGIIGLNGAGKSTLLKILSRITEPTEGRVGIKGRVSSILEVGTGFHPELTGRENIFLNGAILGMTRRDIKARFDEIVSFAEVERFLDTPVKRYSSGMYVRLAFAVAAHLEPDILIVDEVLAVGDIKFQQKCLGKLSGIGGEGRTVLFVSHNMNAIEQLCNKGMLLQAGRISHSGTVDSVVNEYMALNSPEDYRDLDAVRQHGELSRSVEFSKVFFVDRSQYMRPNQDIEFHAEIAAREQVHAARISLTITNSLGNPVGSGFSACSLEFEAGDSKEIRVRIPSPGLAPGKYSLAVAIGTGSPGEELVDFDIIGQVLHFQVHQEAGDEALLHAWPPVWGNVVLGELGLDVQ